MDSDQPRAQAEEPSPEEPTSSVYSVPEVNLDEEIPGPSAPWGEASSSGQKRDWARAFEEEEEEEEVIVEREDIWVVESLCGLRMKLKRRRLSSVLPVHHKAFNRLLNDPVVQRFLAWDTDLKVSGKYLLSMVIAYFSRAGLFAWQYQLIHFFLALYVASDMEEDDEAPKQNIFAFLYGKSYAQRPLFHKLRVQFIKSMGWRTRVTLEECEEIQAYDPEHWAWKRDRSFIS